jgi:hypothetical protein
MRQTPPDLDDEFAHSDQAGSADISHPAARELQHRDLIDLVRQVETLEDLSRKPTTALELRGEPRLALRVRKGVERALDVQKMVMRGVHGDDV